MGRYTRDEILHRSLDMADLATLEAHDRPHGVIMPKAFCIGWLQDILDMFHQRYPFAGELLSVPVLIQAFNEDVILTDISQGIKNLPDDFAIDVTDGLITSYGERNFYRIRKIAFQPWLRVNTWYRSQSVSQPRVLYYTIIQNKIKIVPFIELTRDADLWYYRLPPSVTAEQKPAYPDDWTLIEYVRMRALEWIKHPQFPPGSAQAYAEKELSADRQSGLLQRSEEDQLQLTTYGYLDNDINRSQYGFLSGWPSVAF